MTVTMKQFVNKLAVIMIAVLFAAGCASDPNVESAKLHMVNMDFESMIESAKLAIETNPENGDGYYYLGVGQIQLALTKDVSEREDLYRSARENFDTAAQLYAGQTISSNESNNIPNDIIQTWAGELNAAVDLIGEDFQSTHPDSLTESIYHFQNAYAIEPDSAFVATYIAEAMLVQERYEEVEELIWSIIDSGRATREDYIVLANARLSLGDSDGAFEVMTDIVEQYPDDVAVIEWIAFYHIENNDIEKAVETVTDLISTDPGALRYRLLYRDIFLDEMNNVLDQAQETLAQVPEINDQIRAKARERNRDDAEIERLIAKADEVQKEAEELYMKADDLAVDIAEQFKEYLEINPEDAAAWRELGIIYRNRSVSYLEMRDATADNELAAEYDDKAKELLEETYPHFVKVVEIDEDDTQSWTVLFQIYSNLNMMEEASEAMNRAGL